MLLLVTGYWLRQMLLVPEVKVEKQGRVARKAKREKRKREIF